MTRFRAYVYSAGTLHRKLHQSFVTMSTVTHFILQAHIETALATANTGKKNSEEVWEQNKGEWTERVEVSKEEIPGRGVACMAIYLSLIHI